MQRENRYRGHVRGVQKLVKDDAYYRRSFFAKKPPTYTGVRRGRIARDWIRAIHRILQKIEIPDGHLRVELAVKKFEGSAFSWWKAAKGEYTTHRFTWGDFIALF